MLSCKILAEKWLFCKILAEKWLSCKFLAEKWLSCKILAEKWLSCKFLAEWMLILQDSGRNLARLCIILQDNHSKSIGVVSALIKINYMFCKVDLTEVLIVLMRFQRWSVLHFITNNHSCSYIFQHIHCFAFTGKLRCIFWFFNVCFQRSYIFCRNSAALDA